MKHYTDISILCHASGWCKLSKMAYDKLKVTLNSNESLSMSFRMDSTDLETDNSILKCLNKYNMKKFDFFYETHQINKYEVPSEFKYKVIGEEIRSIHQRSGTNIKKSFCDSLNHATIEGVVKLKFTLYYNSDCKHLHTYIDDWKEIKSLIEEYDYGAIITQDVVDAKYKHTVDLPILEMTEYHYKVI